MGVDRFDRTATRICAEYTSYVTNGARKLTVRFRHGLSLHAFQTSLQHKAHYPNLPSAVVSEDGGSHATGAASFIYTIPRSPVSEFSICSHSRATISSRGAPVCLAVLESVNSILPTRTLGIVTEDSKLHGDGLSADDGS